jgi:hypothetical protein
MAGKRKNPTAVLHARVSQRILPNGSTKSSSADSPLLDQGKLLGLVGYNCRRAYLRILGLFFANAWRKFDLRPVVLDYVLFRPIRM